MASNTRGAAWQHKGKSGETESQDCTVSTDTCVQGARKSAASLTPSARWDKADNNDERLSDAEFTVKEEELECWMGQKILKSGSDHVKPHQKYN